MRKNNDRRGKDRIPVKFKQAHLAITAVAHEVRLVMLDALLQRREIPSGEFAGIGSTDQSQASLHLGKLLRAGLVKAKRKGQSRLYSIHRHNYETALKAVALLAAGASPDPIGDAERRLAEEE